MNRAEEIEKTIEIAKDLVVMIPDGDKDKIRKKFENVLEFMEILDLEDYKDMDKLFVEYGQAILFTYQTINENIPKHLLQDPREQKDFQGNVYAFINNLLASL